MLRGSRRRQRKLPIAGMHRCAMHSATPNRFIARSPFDVPLAFLWAMKRATGLCRKARREMGWHVVTRHHGPEPLFSNLFCIRTHPSLSSSLQRSLWVQRKQPFIIRHQVAIGLDFLIVSIQFRQFTATSYFRTTSPTNHV